MELILISRGKLKIVLTDDEMKKYGIYDTDVISEKKQLTRLFDDIKIRSGFDTSDAKVYIELFESIDGGCEMFITKEARHSRSQGSYDDKKSSAESIITYKFCSAEDVIAASIRLNALPSLPQSKLFCDEYGNLYLICTLKTAHADTDMLIFLDEYGERVRDASIRLYLDEHGKRLCPENAVEILSAL